MTWHGETMTASPGYNKERAERESLPPAGPDHKQPWLEGHVMAEQETTRTAHNFQDLTGKRFGILTVLRRENREPRKVAFWRCACECGQEYVVRAGHLKSGRHTDCGCRRGDRVRESRRKLRESNPQPTATAIVLNNGMAAIVDDADYPNVAKHHWHALKGGRTWYARGVVGGKRVLMHVFLMGSGPDGLTVDHANGNGLDNRKDNLRWASQSQQCHNSHAHRGRSLYKGVSWARSSRKWSAYIKVNDKTKHLGYFDNESDAAKAYDVAARLHHGEFAWLNFPSGQDDAGDVA